MQVVTLTDDNNFIVDVLVEGKEQDGSDDEHLSDDENSTEEYVKKCEKNGGRAVICDLQSLVRHSSL